MNKDKLEKVLWGILAFVMVGYFIFTMISDPFEHIEDTNGNNTSISVIKESEILSYESSRSGGMGRSTTDFEVAGIQLGGVKFHSNKFSGVEPLLKSDILFTTGFYLNIYDYNISSGNFRLYVINEGNIIDVIEPNDEYSHYYENIRGEFVVVAVGESADFEFKMNTSEYDEYYHFQWE